MPYGYLAAVTIIGICALAAFRPPRAPHQLKIAGYFAGLIINEVPTLVLLFLAGSTVSAITFDGLFDTTAGYLTFVVAVLIALVLLALHIRINRARFAIHTSTGMSEKPKPPLWTWLWPFPHKPRSVTRIANVSYGPGGRDHLLDIYRRHDRTGPVPVLIYFHGGGYFSGFKRREGRALWYRMANRGWVVISANYGLRPNTTYPGHLIDAKRVIAWVRQSAEDYHMDPDTIVIAGSSAGAHMAALAALSPNDNEFQPGFEEADTRLAAAICLYGYYGRYYGRGENESPASTPLAMPADNAPPMFIAHGDRDTYVDVDGARALVEHLRAHSPSPVVYAELPGAQHGFDVLASPRNRAVVTGVESFLQREVAQPNMSRRAK